MTRYERLASVVFEQIREGTYREGERLPSIRRLSRSENVSISTATQAYLLLESRGVLEARPRSGYYVKGLESAMDPDGPGTDAVMVPSDVAVSSLIDNVFLAARDPAVVPLGAACPGSELFPTPALNRILRDIIREEPFHSSEYEFPPGCEELRRQLAKRSRDWGCRLEPSEFIITSGGAEAVQLCLRAVAKPGDTVVVESPAYFGTLAALESLGMRALEIACTPDEGMDLDLLARAIEKTPVAACVVTANFNNPSGSLMPSDAKRAFVRLMASRRIPIIDADFYGDLAFGGDRPHALKSLDTEGGILLCSSFSKTLAPGFRIGWTAPGRFRSEVLRLKITSNVATPSLPQRAIARYLDRESYERHCRRISRAFEFQVDRMREAVLAHFPQGTRVSRPRGGFVLWVELPSGMDSLALYKSALERKIGCLPGTLFSASSKYRHFLRLNCGNIWTPRIEGSLRIFGELARAL